MLRIRWSDDDLEDIDLDVEDARLPDGRRLTDDLAGQLAEQTLAEARWRTLIPGSTSLTSGAANPHQQ